MKAPLARLCFGSLAVSLVWAQQQQPQFRGCEYPALDWAAVSGGPGGSQFYTRDAHVLGDHLVVVGEMGAYGGVYELTGPLGSSSDETAQPKTLSRTIETIDLAPTGEVNLPSAEGYDIGINVIDVRTGEPIEALTLNNALGDSMMNSVGAARIATGDDGGGEDRVAIGGRFKGQIHLESTNTCLPQDPEAGSLPTQYSVDCSDGTRLTSALAPELDAAEFAGLDWRASGIGNSALLVSLTINQDAGDDGNDNSNWLLDYNWARLPWTGPFESEVSSTTISSENGDVFAAGKACYGGTDQPLPANCNGVIGRYAGEDGATQWSLELPQLSDVYGIEHDPVHELLFVTGFHGPDDDDFWEAMAPLCPDSTVGCQVVGAVDATNGDLVWFRTLNNAIDLDTFQNGEVKLAHESDGPYIYAVLSVSTDSESLDTGTPYAACQTADGGMIPSYEVVQDRFLTEADCASEGHTFVPWTSPDALSPQSVSSGVSCTANGFNGQGCTMKLHKFTGRPVWATSKVQPRAMEASAAGPIVSGSYRPSRGSFDGLGLRDLGWNEAFQALLDKDTGAGVYVQHFYDYGTHFHGNAGAMDGEGNYYLAARSNPARLLDGDGLDLSFPEPGPFNSALVVLKLDTRPGGATRTPSCLECENNVRTAIRPGFCWVDEICFADGETGNQKLGDGAVVCDAEVSQTLLQDFGGEEEPVGCNICGEGGVVTKPDAVFDASMFGGPEFECFFLDNAGKAGVLPLDLLGLSCSDAQSLLSELCGCEATANAVPTTAPAAPSAAPAVPPPIDGPEIDPAAAVVVEEPTGDGLSTGAIVGITLAGVVAAGIVAAILGRQKLAVNVNVKRKPDENVVAPGDAEAGATALHETDSSALESSAKSENVI